MHGIGDKNKTHFLHKSTLFSGQVYSGCRLVVLKCAVRNTVRNVQSYYQKPEVEFGLHIGKGKTSHNHHPSFFFVKVVTKYKTINQKVVIDLKKNPTKQNKEDYLQ